MQKIIIASDHGGFKLKEHLKKFLLSKDYQLTDAGCDSEESCDYPDFAYNVSEEVANENYNKGILICKSGIGMSIAANRNPGARAALCYNHHAAALSRAHNDANIVVIGSSFVDLDEAERIIDTFLSTDFEAGRHQKRVDKLNSCNC